MDKKKWNKMTQTKDYSRKTIRRFLKPKNFGEIKDADAIGEVGNPTCLLPEEKIFLNNEFTEIKKAKKNDLVLSHLSNKRKIKEILNRNYSGEIVSIKNSLGELNLTSDHLVYAIKLPKKSKYKRIKGKRSLIPSWYHAKHLEKGDIILYPFSKEEKKINYLNLNLTKKKYDFKSKNLPKKFPLNKDFLRLAGYFLSEGNIQDKPSRTEISFSLHIKEKDIVEDIKKISKKLFNLDVKVRERPKTNGVVIYIYSARLARFFKTLFGNGAAKKKIPENIMNLPSSKQRALIFGLWKGDGCINLTRTGPRASYATISYQLAQQIKTLLLKQGIIPSIYSDKPRVSKWANHQEAYRIHVGQRESLIKLSKILKEKYLPKSYASTSSWIKDNYLYCPITKISKKKYSGKVYNLEVEEDHSFTSESLCLHNCGDIMHLYLKINPKTQKITKIKFKTYGCAAAIASTEQLTKIAKGLTLEQAEKLQMKDVADSLKGLPQIKLHCSSMAIQALKKAIKEYKENGK